MPSHSNLIIVSLFLTLVSCGGSSDPTPVAPPAQTQPSQSDVTSIRTEASKKNLVFGESIVLTASLDGTGSFDKRVVWKLEEGSGTLSGASNMSITYTAPASGETTAVISATSVANPKLSARITLVVTTRPDQTAPTVLLQVPQSPVVTAGKVKFTALATDDVAVSKVELYDGDRLVGSASAQPYSFEIAYSLDDNGEHILSAKAYDASGHETTSAPTKFTVEIPYQFAKIGVPVTAPNGLTVTLQQAEPGIGSDSQYYITYDLENKTQQPLDEGAFRLFYKDSGSANQYGFFGKIRPGEKVTRTATLTLATGGTPGLLAYNNEFFGARPDSHSLVWNADFSLAANNGYSSIPYLWVRQDEANSLYSIGGFSSLAPVADSGVVALKQVGVGISSVSISRYSSEGTMLWEKITPLNAITPDNHKVIVGNKQFIYVSGNTRGTLEGTSNGGGQDAFLIKMDLSGNILWERQFGTAGDDAATGLAETSSGDVLVVGNTGKSGSGLMRNIFITKFDAAGNQVWTTDLSALPESSATAVVLNGQDEAFIAGNTYNSDTPLIGQDASNAFLAKISTTGGLVWNRQFGSPYQDEVAGLALSGQKLFVAVNSSGRPDPSPSYAIPGTAQVYSYSDTGDQRWTSVVGVNTYRAGPIALKAIATGPNGELVVSGTTSNPLFGEVSFGPQDSFFANISDTGTIGKINIFGKSSASAITINNNGEVYLAGGTNFDFSHPYATSKRSFLTKYAYRP